MAKLLYEDKIELMWGGEVGEEMYGPFGKSAVKNVVELAPLQTSPDVSNDAALVAAKQQPA